MKYKVGDKVRLGVDSNSLGGKAKLVGEIATIGKVSNNGWGYPYVMTPDNGYAWCDAELSPVVDSKIVITVNGSETLARLYEGNKVIKSASAKCSPEDTFDFSVGAKIAFERLMGIEPKKCVEGEGAEKPKEFKVGDTAWLKPYDEVEDHIGITRDTWENIRKDSVSIERIYDVYTYFCKACDGKKWFLSKEVLTDKPVSKYKPGDKVKIIGNTCFHFAKVGEIITLKNDNVNQNYFPEDSHKWTYEEHRGYICEADIEPYVEPKYYNGKVVCISSDRKHWKPGKVYEVKDGVITDDDGTPRIPRFKTFDDLQTYFGNINSKIKFIPFVE